MTQQFTPRYLPKRNKTHVRTKTHTLIVHRSFICNRQKLETTQMSVSELISRLWNIYPVEHYSATKRRKPTIDICKNIMNLQCIYVR